MTFKTPKPLLPLLNRPLLEYVVQRCSRHAIGELLLSTNYLPDHFSGSLGSELDGVGISYVHEEEPLGTAGGVKNCESEIDDTFFVFNGDVVTDLDLTSMLGFHRERGAVATIYLTPVEDPSAYGVVPLDGEQKVEAFIEKPAPGKAPTNLINGGVYVLEPEVLKRVPAGEPHSFEHQLFPALVDEGEPVYGYPSDAYWMDIGTPPNYLQVQMDMLTGRCAAGVGGTETSPGVWVEGEVEIAPDAVVEGPVLLGAGTYIGAGARITGPVSMGPGCEVGPMSRIATAVLGEEVIVGSSCDVDEAILGDRCCLGDGVIATELSVVGPGATVAEGNELRRGMRIWPDVEVGPSAIQF